MVGGPLPSVRMPRQPLGAVDVADFFFGGGVFVVFGLVVVVVLLGFGVDVAFGLGGAGT